VPKSFVTLNIIDYPRLIKNLTRRINYGVGGDYQELRRLKREYASTFKPIKPGVFDIPRTALRLLHVEDFPVGSIVRCGKYFIWCKGRQSVQQIALQTYKCANGRSTSRSLSDKTVMAVVLVPPL